MKLGTKSHLISAYSALFTVACGVLLWDFVRRSSTEETELTPEKAQAAPVAKTGDASSLPG
jgi:hypothetical protein